MKRKAFRVHETTSTRVVLNRGSWSEEEDLKLTSYINNSGIGNWTDMPRAAGLLRTPKSCRLRWMNYLKPGLRHGSFTMEEVATIIKMQKDIGNRWATIAAAMPGRTDNDIKNFWNTHLKKIVLGQCINTMSRHDSLENLSYGNNSKEEASKCTGLPSYENSTDSDGITMDVIDRRGGQIGDSARTNECGEVPLLEDHGSWAGITDDNIRLGSPFPLAYHEFQDPYQFCQWWPLDSFRRCEDVGSEDFSIDLWHHIA